MTLSYKQLTELLTEMGPSFTIEVMRPDGKKDVYRGHDVSAFVAHNDKRMHEHRVFDSQGQLVYHRDINGMVHIGTAEQHYKALRAKKVGRAAVTGVQIFGDSVRRALRYWRQ